MDPVRGMDDSTLASILLGITFLLGPSADAIGRRALLPRGTMVPILVFMLAGPLMTRNALGRAQRLEEQR